MKNGELTRRDSIRLGPGSLAVGAIQGCSAGMALEDLMQGPLREMSDEELADTITRLERKYRDRYGVDFDIRTTPARTTLRSVSAIDISRCIGCRECVYGCLRENNVSRDVEIHWI